MKILEFGADGDSASPASPDAGKAMKILEFGKDQEDSQKTVATAKDVGHIKIVEFDDDLKAQKVPVADKPRKAVGAVKIKEFDKETEARGPGDAAPKIKIMEFD